MMDISPLSVFPANQAGETLETPILSPLSLLKHAKLSRSTTID